MHAYQSLQAQLTNTRLISHFCRLQVPSGTLQPRPHLCEKYRECADVCVLRASSIQPTPGSTIRRRRTICRRTSSSAPSWAPSPHHASGFEYSFLLLPWPADVITSSPYLNLGRNIRIIQLGISATCACFQIVGQFLLVGTDKHAPLHDSRFTVYSRNLDSVVILG